jgi:hypothetical protein
MNAITSFFLRAKHWQIFLLFFGMMLLAQIAMFNSMLSAKPHDPGKDLLPFFSVTLLFMLCFNGWFWIMGSFLNALVRPQLRPRLGLFRFALIYPILYLPIFMISFPQQPTTLAFIFPLHLLATFCMFYLLNFVSRNLVLAETGRNVTFYDYAGPFFLLWFFPIGVWIVQPRINRLYAERKIHEMSSEVTAS